VARRARKPALVEQPLEQALAAWQAARLVAVATLAPEQALVVPELAARRRAAAARVA
jgi:hypothetical protein